MQVDAHNSRSRQKINYETAPRTTSIKNNVQKLQTNPDAVKVTSNVMLAAPDDQTLW